MDLIASVAIALLLYLGRISIQHKTMTAGSFITFLIAVFTLYDPVRKFAAFYNSFQQAIGASDEIFRFMDAHDDVQEKKRALVLKGFKDQIQFENVGFAYETTKERRGEVLHDIDLTVKRGEVIALVGPSGAGKSSLVNLIPRFFDVNEGKILIDGHDLRDVTIASLREQIGKVTQETVLFNDTVRNNIAYGQPDVPIAKVEEAAQMALAHDFILNMPDGYNTVIGERGLRLSGGERQRLAIARAILKNAPILILDEATSALDTESELYVQAALANLMRGRTVFVIAHRLSTVRRATRIVVIERRTDYRDRHARRVNAALGNVSAALQHAVCRRGHRPRWRGRSDGEDGGNCVSEIYSMTGYATLRGSIKDNVAFTLSMKSVNHRFLDLSFRLPSYCDGLEMQMRRLLKERLRRGHVDVTLQFERRASAEIQLNAGLLSAYMLAYREACDANGLAYEPDLNAMLRIPGMMTAESSSATPEELAGLEAAVLAQVEPLIEKLDEVRAQEGVSLAAELRASMLRLKKPATRWRF